MSQKQAFVGIWRIVEMELWDKDSFDLVNPAHIAHRIRRGQRQHLPSYRGRRGYGRV